MKFLLLCAALIAAIIVVGCSSDTPTTPAVNAITAKIDGVAFAGSLSTTGSFSSGLLSIGGSDANSKTITIAVPSAAVQTYTFGTGGSFAAVNVSTGLTADKLFSANFVSGSGTLAITELSATRAKGTFSVKAVNPSEGTSVNVTEGVFDVKF